MTDFLLLKKWNEVEIFCKKYGFEFLIRYDFEKKQYLGNIYPLKSECKLQDVLGIYTYDLLMTSSIEKLHTFVVDTEMRLKKEEVSIIGKDD